MKQIKSILISQPKPDTKSPFFSLAQRHSVDIDFRPFIQVEGVSAKEFRKNKVDISEFSAIIFTSRGSIDHFFRICEDLRIKMSQDTKYFCVSKTIALYLQKFILYRKRKVFYDKVGNTNGLKTLLKKHKKNETFLLPCSETRKNDLPLFLADNGFNYAEAPLYKTVACDLTDIDKHGYDMIVFFSPLGVKSLYHNFPDYKQNGHVIAAFGPSTSRTIEEYGLRLDIKAPIPGITSMTMAIDKYLKQELSVES